MIVVVASILAIAIVITITIFGDTPLFRGTFVQKSRSYLVKHWNLISKWVHQWNYTYFNGRLEKLVGWLVPLFYVCVVTFCIYHFFQSTYPNLPFKNNSAHLLLIWLSISLVYLFTFLVTFSDPGIITAENVDGAQKFANNELIFFNNRACSTCKTVKPARSKHCSVCGHCVMLFDHHCIWVNNCIGYYNYRWFMGYLLANINFLIHGGILTIWTLRSHKLPTQSYWSLIKSNEAMKLTGTFAILCIIFTFITSAFTILHLRYIYLGVTTNEYEKWAEIEHLIGLGALYKCENYKVDYVERAVNYSNNGYETVYISLDDATVLFRETDNVTCWPVTSMQHDLHNIYDLGFWDNLKQRLLL